MIALRMRVAKVSVKDTSLDGSLYPVQIVCVMEGVGQTVSTDGITIKCHDESYRPGEIVFIRMEREGEHGTVN